MRKDSRALLHCSTLNVIRTPHVEAVGNVLGHPTGKEEVFIKSEKLLSIFSNDVMKRLFINMHLQDE